MKFFRFLHRIWFAAAPPERLAILRISSGGFSLWYLWTRFDMFERMATSGSSNFRPVGVLEGMPTPLNDETYWWFAVIVMVFNALYILGVKHRFTGPVFALMLLLFLTYRNSWGMIYHSRMAVVLHVFVLGITASADALSFDAWWKYGRRRLSVPSAHWQYGWPVVLICALTAMTYFLAGVAKVAGELAVAWADGSAMRSQVAVDALRKVVLGSEAPELFVKIYKHTWLFLIMGIGTLILELGAPFVVLNRKIGKLWAIGTWLMHWGIYFIMGITFRYQMTGLIFLPFFDVEKLVFWKKFDSSVEEGDDEGFDV